ncbi:uncharacterized protein LOC131952164 isoform X2 [Physella acuta]|uniref:uncharacterized protein LOC131952164 isoform X2 n=1 Tax=Physella acuta TaxID=109671 RepID=UPI0027DC3394|nr:uncharacterized protein LOC131952164 isoform X2 [Physella acuta]
MDDKDKPAGPNNSGIVSPPPHLTTFQNALSDYSTVYEAVPDIPPRGYEGKGKLYTVPETEPYSSPKHDGINWDDSDEEERVLKELRREREKQKKQQPISWDRKPQTISDKTLAAADNHGYVPSPKITRSSESNIDRWAKISEPHQMKSPSLKINEISSDPVKKTLHLENSDSKPPFHQANRGKILTSPVIIKDATGKSCIFYFEEGNPHFLEVSEDEVDAYLPEKVDEWEKLFRRVWREIFAALRIVTSIFILFVAELILFLVHHILRPLILDSTRAIGDFLLKPFLTLIFNVILQPFFALMWNTLNALAQAFEPIIRLLGALLTQVAIVVRAFRLFVIHWNSAPPSSYRHEMEMV